MDNMAGSYYQNGRKWNSMRNLFYSMVRTLEKGEDVVLCSILASSGSTPRGAGAKMLVFQDGSTLGTIGGGAVELIAGQQAKEVFVTRQSHLKGFCLTPNQVADIGMICGGSVTVYYQLFDHLNAKNLEVLRRIYELLCENTNAWLVNQIRENEIVQMGVYDEKRGLQYTDCFRQEELKPLLKSRSVYLKGEPAYYFEPIVQSGCVYIFGGGHVGRALIPELDRIGFRVVLYDSRAHIAKPELFPMAANVICGEYNNIGAYLSVTKDDYIIIMTPGHQSDYKVLEQALRTPATYVGCIGSSHKVAATKARLLAAGLTETDTRRVHSPIGLPIGGETPEEIAVSIAAELIQHRAAIR